MVTDGGAIEETRRQVGPARRERRRHHRYEFPGAVLQFGFPAPLGEHREQPLKDVSLAGIAFYFPADCCIGRVTVGQVIHGVRLLAADEVIELDLLVMRVEPAGEGRMVCGGLAYWKTLEDFERLKGLLERAEQGAPVGPGSPSTT